MNVTLSKRLPTFTVILKDNKDELPLFVDSSGLYLNLKRISIDNEDGSIEICLTNTIVDLPNNRIIVKSNYVEDFDIVLTNYEVDQINVLLVNYLNLINEKTTLETLG